MHPQVTKLKRMALDLLFPQWCVGCGREGDMLCPACRLSLLPIEPPICPRCGLPQPEGVLCPGCAAAPAEIDGIRSPFLFEGVTRRAVHELKYHNIRALAEPLAGLLYDYLVARPLPADVLVPVPLHPRRRRERGYNQSGLLARELGRLAGMPVVDECLFRRHYTSPQARAASIQQRRSQMADAFACRDGGLAGCRVLLIDDVTTSGATLNACAGALKSAGAASVWGLTVAAEP